MAHLALRLSGHGGGRACEAILAPSSDLVRPWSWCNDQEGSREAPEDPFQAGNRFEPMALLAYNPLNSRTAIEEHPSSELQALVPCPMGVENVALLAPHSPTFRQRMRARNAQENC